MTDEERMLVEERNHKVMENRGLAHALGHQMYQRNPFVRRIGSEDDVIQEALLALVKAVDQFKPELGWRFSTYAARVIKNYLKQQACALGLIYTPRGYLPLAFENPGKAYREAPRTAKREATLAQYRTACGTIRETGLGCPASRLSGAFAVKPFDWFADDCCGYDVQDVEKALPSLPWQDQWVLSHYYGLGGREPVSLPKLSSHPLICTLVGKHRKEGAPVSKQGMSGILSRAEGRLLLALKALSRQPRSLARSG